jgi:hypothetical protein
VTEFGAKPSGTTPVETGCGVAVGPGGVVGDAVAVGLATADGDALSAGEGVAVDGEQAVRTTHAAPAHALANRVERVVRVITIMNLTTIGWVTGYECSTR